MCSRRWRQIAFTKADILATYLWLQFHPKSRWLCCWGCCSWLVDCSWLAVHFVHFFPAAFVKGWNSVAVVGWNSVAVVGYLHRLKNAMFSKPARGVKRKPRFELPSDDIEGWLRGLKSNDTHQDTHLLSGVIPSSSTREAGRNPAAPSNPPNTLDRHDTRDQRKRRDMPVVRRNPRNPRAAMADVQQQLEGKSSMQEALHSLVGDFYAASSNAPRTSQLKTWERYHVKWFGDDVPVWPLTDSSILRVSSLFKLGGYKSFKNYMSRAKDHHVMLGYTWSDRLDSISKKCCRSVLRGLAGSVRSMDFDLQRLVEFLPDGRHSLHDEGPVHSKAMIITSTMFLLREVEASAIDWDDITFEQNKVSLFLPVSKTDWQAKGCTRSWSCVCDSDLPCVVHVLKSHCKDLKNFYNEFGEPDGSSRPLFPSSDGSYCTKQGVIAMLRKAVEISGGNPCRGDGSWAYSGHAFRITGPSQAWTGLHHDPATWTLGQQCHFILPGGVTTGRLCWSS